MSFDEPIKGVLDNLVSDLMVKVLERYYGGDESNNRLPECETYTCSFMGDQRR